MVWRGWLEGGWLKGGGWKEGGLERGSLKRGALKGGALDRVVWREGDQTLWHLSWVMFVFMGRTHKRYNCNNDAVNSHNCYPNWYLFSMQ